MRNGYIFLKNETILQLIIFYFLKQYLNSRKGMFKNMKKQGCLGGVINCISVIYPTVRNLYKIGQNFLSKKMTFPIATRTTGKVFNKRVCFFRCNQPNTGIKSFILQSVVRSNLNSL